MLTVKHVTNRSESIFEADSVSLDKSDEKGNTLFIYMNDGVTGSFDRGTVYIMNRDGRTVSTFHFDEPLDLQNPPLS